MMRRVLLLLLALTGYFTWLTSAARAEDAPVPEDAMKVVYLYNFAQLTDWPEPAGSDSTFKLCFYGPEELSQALEKLRGRTIGSRPIRPLRVAEAGEARQCQMLFIGDADFGRAGRLIEALRGHPVLIVTDDAHLARLGAMLLIQREARRLAFEVNIEAARRSQLRFSSKLLRLAQRVSGE